MTHREQVGSPPPSPAAPRGRSMLTPSLWLGVALTACAYLYALDSLAIPSIGDEMLYVEITRFTAAQGHLLPLVAGTGITDTKPPLLFWQGILTTDWGRHWDLWHLRLPLVGYSVLTAALAGLVAARLSRSRRTGLLAALIFLGFWSTFQHGRAYLVNGPETLFLFLPLALLLLAGEFTWPVAVASGLALGLASLYKSCLLIAPVGVALALILWARRRGQRRRFFRRDLPALAVMGALGLALFALWLVLDPRPDLIVQRFLVGENVSKLRLTNYVAGLYGGNYPVWRIWLGDFWNAGFYALPLAGLCSTALRRAHQGAVPPDTPAEGDLWRYVLAFLAVYSVPSQRQENYLLPTMAAVSVLLALNWHRIPAWWHRSGALLAAAALALVVWLMTGVQHAAPEAAYPRTAFAAMTALLVVAVVGCSSADRARALLPAAVAGVWLSIAVLVGPLAGPLRTDPTGPGLTALAGRRVYFPAVFPASEEQYRFLLPESYVVGYHARGSNNEGERLLAAGEPTAVWERPDAGVSPGYVRYGERLEALQRLSNADIVALLVHARYDLWVRRLVIVQRTPGGQGAAR